MAVVSFAAIVAWIVWGPPPPAPPQKPVADDPLTRAQVYCLALQTSPEYRVSSAGGDYRHRADELCDELKREAIRKATRRR